MDGLAKARQLAAAGDLREAVRAYLAAGAAVEAIQLLVEHQRHVDAGRLVLHVLGVQPDEVGRLQGKQRVYARRAADYFASGQDFARANQVLIALGESPLTPSAPRRPEEPPPSMRARDSTPPHRPSPGSAATRSSGGPPSSRQGEPPSLVRQAIALHRQDRSEEALELLLGVAEGDPEHRRASVLAVEIADALDVVDFQLDHLVSGFAFSRPQNKRELDAMYLLGRLYERHGLDDSASDLYDHLRATAPGYGDVEERRRRLSRRSVESIEQIVAEDAAFERATRDQAPLAAELPELPPLPELDGAGDWTEPPRGWSNPPGDDPTSTPRRGSPALADGRDGEPLDVTDMPPGTRVAERYQVVGRLGSGGMATVYEVKDLELGAPTALKIFDAGVDDEALVERFRRELMLTRELAHPNVVRVYDIGVHQGHRFMTMERLVGEELTDMIDRGRIELSLALDLLVQACRGLHAAHRQGVTHRDIKPANLFVTDDGQVKLMDFGIAKKHGDVKRLTIEGYTAGTPAYMAPEQVQSFADVSPKSDQYSLGIVAYEMLTGDLPFFDPDPMRCMFLQVMAEVPPPSRHVPGLPKALDELLLKVLAKKPDQRLASCQELELRLLDIAAAL